MFCRPLAKSVKAWLGPEAYDLIVKFASHPVPDVLSHTLVGARMANNPTPSIWHDIHLELKELDAGIEDRIDGYLPNLYKSLKKSFISINTKVQKGSIRPYAQLTLSKRSPNNTDKRLSPIDDELRIGVLGLAGNPLHWGHENISYIAMDQLNLDTYVFLLQGGIRYKNVLLEDKTPNEDRHQIVRETMESTFPLLRYSDVGKDNDDIAEINIYKIFDLNPDQKMKIFYTLGVETIEHLYKGIRNNYRVARKNRLGSNPKHSLSLAVIVRGEYGQTLDQEILDRIMIEVAFENTKLSFLHKLPSRLLRTIKKSLLVLGNTTPSLRQIVLNADLIQDPYIDLGVDSTYYRKTHDPAAVRKNIHQWAIENGYYGHPQVLKDSRPNIDQSANSPAEIKSLLAIEAAKNSFVLAEALRASGEDDRATENESRGYSHIEDAVGIALQSRIKSNKPIQLIDHALHLQAPVRLGLASGLGSDLFVVSMTEGGSVLNTAITLNGIKPIDIKIKPISEFEIRITSIDQNVTDKVIRFEDFHNPSPQDPLALYLAALLEADIVSASSPESFRESLMKLGGGLEIIAEVHGIPKGSGLGVSSILGITLIKGLFEITNRPIDNDELLMHTISLEQRLHVLGGWQDPVGGAFGGVKWIQAKPGNPVPTFVNPNIPEHVLDELKSRLLLVYSGEPHFAGDPLQQIITGYLLQHPKRYPAMREGQKVRDQMYKALLEGDIDAFGSLLSLYWDATIKLHGKLATNDFIDDIFHETKSLSTGGKVSGAGGGFIFLVAKKGKEIALRKLIEQKIIGKKAKIYEWDIDNDGITMERIPLNQPADADEIAVPQSDTDLASPDRQFGTTDLQFYPLSVGTVWFGRKPPMEEKEYTYPEQAEIDSFMMKTYQLLGNHEGVVMVDTASSYGFAEERLGTFLKNNSNMLSKTFIATKWGEKFDAVSDQTEVALTKTDLVESVQKSLSHLPKIDLLYIHKTNLEVLKDQDVMDEMRRLKKINHGGIRLIGASISHEPTLETAIADNLLTDLDVIQMPSTLFLKRQDLVSALHRMGKAIVINSPVSRFKNKSARDAHLDLLRHKAVSTILTGTRTHLSENHDYVEEYIAKQKSDSKLLRATQHPTKKAARDKGAHMAKGIDWNKVKLVKAEDVFGRPCSSRYSDKALFPIPEDSVSVATSSVILDYESYEPINSVSNRLKNDRVISLALWSHVKTLHIERNPSNVLFDLGSYLSQVGTDERSQVIAWLKYQFEWAMECLAAISLAERTSIRMAAQCQG